MWEEFLKHHENIIESNNPQNEHDWEQLGKKQFASNLKNASEQLDDVINEKNVSSLVLIICSKVKNLQECLDESGELSEEDFKNLKEANSILWQIMKGYK